MAGDLDKKLPNLTEISLVNNDVRSFSDIKRLEKCKKLKILSLTRNPVVLQPHYRQFVVHTLPNLKFLDFSRIRDKERKEAKKFFETTAVGKDLMKKIVLKVREEKETMDFDEEEADIEETEEEAELRKMNKENLFDASVEKFNPNKMQKQLQAISDEHRAKIKSAILKATSIEEVERLNRMLQAGYIPE